MCLTLEFDYVMLCCSDYGNQMDLKCLQLNYYIKLRT